MPEFNPPSPELNPYTNPGGLVGEVMAYTLASSPRPVPEIALAGAIGFIAGIVGRNFRVRTRSRIIART